MRDHHPRHVTMAVRALAGVIADGLATDEEKATLFEANGIRRRRLRLRYRIGGLVLAASCTRGSADTAQPSDRAVKTTSESAASVDPAPLLHVPPERQPTVADDVADEVASAQAQGDPRAGLLPCSGPRCGVIEEVDGSRIYYELDAEGAPLPASSVEGWWCYDAEAVAHGTSRIEGRLGQCFHRLEVCEQERASLDRSKGSKATFRTSKQCEESRKAACMFATHRLEDTRIAFCWSNFETCEAFRTKVLGGSDPSNGNLNELTDCEALLPWEWR